MKKAAKKIIFLTAGALAGMYAYNKFVASVTANKNALTTKNGSFYSWRQGNIFYTKTGTGKPLLLIHDTNSASSSVEWSKITKYLQKNHTVYTIDLLGCGRSDKPNLCYTNYMYVQLLTSFLKDIVGEKADVVASNFSSSFVIMANQIEPDKIDRMIFINPVSLSTVNAIPDQESKLKQTIINLPLVGTYIYNLLMNPKRIDRQFRRTFFKREQLVSSSVKDAFYEGAHKDNSSGKYLYSSILGNYMNIDLRHAIKKSDKPIHLIASTEIKSNYKTIQEYKKQSPKIDVTHISNCRLYPQLEIPAKTAAIIENLLK